MAQEFTINGITTALLSIDQVMVINDQSREVSTWLLDTFFPRRMSFDSDSVPVAELGLDNPVAPYVSPCVEGRPLRSAGSANVNYVKAAYLKPKETITPCTVYDSAILARLREASNGSMFNGKMSDAEALILDQVQKADRLMRSIDNKRLLMAAEVLTTGKLVVASDDQPHYEVDFGRDASAAFAPAVTWDLSTSKPVQDIIEMVALSASLANTSPRIALTTSKVWSALRKHQDFNDNFILPNAGIVNPYQKVLTDPRAPQLMGYMDGIAIWVFDAGIQLNDGTFKRFLPEDFFALVSDTNGVLCQCKIQNLKAMGRSDEYFMSQWYNEDPSALFMMAESSPLLVPSNVNGVIGGTGFVA